MSRWGRLEGVGLFVCSNCESFESAAPSRPQGCAGQGISATARPCALDRHGFGPFKPVEIPDASRSVDFTACAKPDELLFLLYLVRRQLVDVINGARTRLHVGLEAIVTKGRRGLILGVNSRSVYLVDDQGKWRAPVGSVELADHVGGS